MKSIKYQIVSPKKFEAREVEISEVPQGQVLLKTLLTGVCRADLRYFFGRRDPEILKKKYPMCLLHEGVAEVIESSGKFKKGDKVVVIPNIPCYIHNKSGEKCASCKQGIGENYCLDVKFMSSNCDGMSQTYFLQPIECVAFIPKDVPDEIAVLSELLTVVYRAAEETGITENEKIAVFGCGPTGYLMAALLYFVKQIKKENLYVFDLNDKKLDYVKEFATGVNIKNEKILIEFDKVFECVGGRGAETAINQAMNLLKPKGMLMLLGVNEEKIPFQTRTILEKGLTIKGTTRSPRQDYPIVLEALKNKKFQDAMYKIICEQRFKGPEELNAAFEKADDPKNHGKVLIEWN